MIVNVISFPATHAKRRRAINVRVGCGVPSQPGH